MSTHIPVLVVGAGPTGLALACELRRQGIECRVVDRAIDRPNHQARALTVWPGALEVLDRHGIAGQVTEAGVQMTGARYWSGDRTVALVRFPGVDMPMPICEPQPAVEGIMRTRLTDLGGRIEWNTELIDLTDGPESVTVELNGPEGPERLQADWVVGCDGTHSKVRELTGIQFDGQTYSGTYILGDGRITGDGPVNEVHYHLHPDGILVVVPLPDGDLRVFADGSRVGEADETPTQAQIQQLIDERSPYALRVQSLRWSTRFQVHQRRAATYRAGRCLLAGDAAHVHSPAGGQGMNTGIQDGDNLASKLALILRGAEAEPLLAGYEAERAPVATTVMRAAHQQTRMWGLRGRLGRGLRDLVLGRLSKAGVLENKIVPQLAQNDLDYRDSPAVGALGGRRAIGPDLADVTLTPTDGPAPIRLSKLLHEPRHTLLVVPGPGSADEVRDAVAAVGPLADRVAIRVLSSEEDLAELREFAPLIRPATWQPTGRLADCRLILIRRTAMSPRAARPGNRSAC